MIQAKAHYACVAVIELAMQSAHDRPVSLREITARHAIPHPFLVQIVQQLKIAGIVSSTRGSQGGYRLNRDPETLTLQEVIEAVGVESGSTPLPVDENPVGQELGRVWSAASTAYAQVLSKTRIIDLIQGCEASPHPMFHI